MKLKLAISAITAAVLIGGGTYTALAASHGTDSTDSTDSARAERSDRAPAADGPAADGPAATPTAATAPGARGELTAGEAVAAALARFPGAVSSVERDDDRAGRWEVDLFGADDVRRELTVDAADGTVRVDRAGRDDDGDDDARDRAALRAAAVDVRQAAVAALASVPGTVTSAEIDDAPGARWEVEVRGEDGREHELNVDARTAKVTADHDGDHDDRDAHDDHDGDRDARDDD
ncbi:PepSY domain-containing protein [Streptomyces corynorhini]|uniref:Peptidase M4 n=1 Tax=Streptomyces corynorhini TaxID=2282652 RepID=A0A370BDL0_9ACTN|nr:PepSY domain-containing protein [Streptomyces corynorhini]RDG37525.1 peptidase M4 [Streptomyces corynorhini]